MFKPTLPLLCHRTSDLHWLSKTMSLAQQVCTHLVHYNLWTGVAEQLTNGHVLLCGYPPYKLDEQDGANEKEWVVPCSMDADVTLDTVEEWFKCAAANGPRPRRLTLALANDDGSVVYYFVHDGVARPRQN